MIKFDQILLNDRDGYEPVTGIFTISGTYLFIYNFGHHSTSETWLELLKDVVAHNGTVVEGHYGTQNIQGGNAAILHRNRGNIIWVEI